MWKGDENIKLRKMSVVGNALRIFNKSYHREEQKTYVIQCNNFEECKNNKNQNDYILLGRVINATNNMDGQTMYLYSDGKSFYVREQKEFWNKFTIS